MKFKNILLILSCLLVALLCVGSVAAIEDANIDDNNLTADSSDVEVVDESASDEKLSVSSDDSTLAEPKTIYVDDIGEVHTEMNDHTIKKAIDEANAGDTIIIKGKFYYHCHLIIDKQLTIKSEVGTILDPCSSVASSGYSGIFYITKGGSGTVIEGFNFVDDDPKLQDNSYGILVKGASGVVVRNSTFTFQTMGDAIRFENSNNALIENVSISGCDNAIKFKNSQDMNINDVEVKKSNIGINVIDSTKTVISNSTISDNKLAGIAFSGSGSDLNVIYSNITDNFNGINVTAPKNVYILSNYIAFNKRNGIYIDNPITLIEIKGNFFNQNAYWEIFNDFHVRDSAFSTKGNKLEVIDNNYMINAGSGSEDIDRPVWTQMYEYKPGYGQYSYDSAKDIYVYVGNGGDYDGHQDKMFLSYVFEINEYMHCPNTYVSPRNIWAQSGNYELEISEITQVKKGTYQVSIVDENGNVATDLSSVPVTFYLNKEGKSATPKEGDVYKTVMMKNGTATVKFDADDFKETGNVLTAVFPTPGTNIDSKVSKTLAINDDDIPGEVLETEIVVSEFTTYPYSNEFLVATLIDSNGKAIAGETLSFAIKTKVYNITTDANGKANLTIGLAKEGTHDFNITFAGSDDYYGSSAQTCVYIKKLSSQIVSSNVYMIPGRTEYYSITLRDENGNAITGGKVTFTVNGKTYSRTTNSKGVASVGLQFTTEKTYTITIKFAGDNKYKASSKSNKIIAKYSSKDDKLITPTLTIPPGTSTYYTVTLKTGDGRAFANQKLTIVIDGKTYTRTTNANGQAKVSIKFTSLNKYKVSASYKGSKVYKPASSTGYITVAKTGTKIAAPTISKLPSESKDFTISLKTSDGKGIAKQSVDISVNGRTYTRTTNDNGQATLLMQLVREKTYPVTVSYKGTSVYKSTSATGYLIVSKANTDLECYNRTFSKNAIDDYRVTLKDASGNSLAGQEITYSLNGVNKSATTDSNGKINVDVSSLNVGSYEFSANYAGDALSYNPTDNAAVITIVDKSGIIFVDEDLPNDEIQNILDNAPEGSDVEFLGDYYFNISLKVNNGLNIYSKDKTILNAKGNSPVFNIEADDVVISGFSLQGNSGDAVVINNANGVSIYNNSIANHLDESKIESYVDGTVNLPGYGVLISNSSDVEINQNYIEVFESGIFAEYSSDIAIENNTLRENNYGIKYGFGVVNTQILNNEIVECIGLYIMTVPEGPSGYGIFLNNSAVNVTINSNHIAYNHMGISLDAKDSTGIVITQNTITDNVLEGIRFNAGYDVAENAVKPLVTDNAIYRNARGPSMMILGELSANPEGIYGGGLYNDSQKLQLDANWYGTNTLKTWDYETDVVGYGTMCPRINTTEIKFYNVTSQGNGKYSIIFYKNGEIASNLPEFDLYATLNRGTSKAVEVNFASTNGVAEFSFDASDFDSTKNTIEISIGSLLNSTSRVFKSLYSFEV